MFVKWDGGGGGRGEGSIVFLILFVKNLDDLRSQIQSEINYHTKGTLNH